MEHAFGQNNKTIQKKGAMSHESFPTSMFVGGYIVGRDDGRVLLLDMLNTTVKQ